MLDGRYRFDTFVVGASNRLAVSAAHAVSRAPGEVYNPLFFLGAQGMGKTHLLAALGHAACALRPELATVYVTLEDLLAELHEAEAAGTADVCRGRYESLDLLLLDDVRLADASAETQVELLRILMALQARGGQVVMAGDRAPALLPSLDARLHTRIAAGLTVDIGQPEYETRLAILRNTAAARGLACAPGALEEIARTQTSNVRELRAAFNRLVAQQPPAAVPATRSPAVRPVGGAATATPAATPTAGTTRTGRAAGVTSGTPAAPGSTAPRPAAPDEYESFVTEIASAVSKSVEPWRVRLGESIARWSAEGYRTALLERHLEGGEPPDLGAVEKDFVATVERLRVLEGEAARLDPKLGELATFRDPERLAEAERVVQRALAAYDPAPAPHAHFTIDNFVAGVRNQLALRSACEAIALPGSRYNPLYLHGPSGAGKTHLAHAIGNALAARERGVWSIACVNAAAFAEELVDALQDGTLDRWRLRYRAADVFIVDDVHALAGCEAAQEELLGFLETLHGATKQIVLAARTPPGNLGGVMPALVARFDAGLVVEIGHVPHAERVARYTPVPIGAEAAAPTIDVSFDDGIAEPATPSPVGLVAMRGKVDTFFLDPEKVVIEWPGLDGVVIEEYR